MYASRPRTSHNLQALADAPQPSEYFRRLPSLSTEPDRTADSGFLPEMTSAVGREERRVTGLLILRFVTV